MDEAQTVSLIIPKKYGISEESSNVIAKNCIPIIQEFNNLEIEFDLIMQEKEITAEICKSSKSLRNKYVKVRTGGDKVIQAAKDEVQKQVEAHNQLRRNFKEEITSRENQLREKELYFEKIEAARLDKIRKERSTELEKYETLYDAGDVALLDNVLWGHFLNGVKADYEEKKEAEKKAEEERIEKERLQKLHSDRKESILHLWQFVQIKDADFSSYTAWESFVLSLKKQKTAFDKKQAVIKAENERLKKEAEEKLIADEKAEKERLRLAKIEQDKQKAREDKASDEKAKMQKQLDEQAKAERKRKATEQLELVKIQEEKKAKAEQNRLLELAPVKDKLKRWINELEIPDPTNSKMDKETFEIVENIMIKYNEFKSWAKDEIEKIE